MVSLVTARNTILFGGAIAAGIAAFSIAYGRDEGKPMRLPVLPKVVAAGMAAGKAPVTPRWVEPPPLPTSSATTPSVAPVKPTPDVAQQIAVLVEPVRKRITKLPIVSGAVCEPVARAEQTRITKLVLAWVNSQHRDERPSDASEAGMGEYVGVGCADPDGVLVTVAQDRADKKTKRDSVRRNYVLRVLADHIDVVADRTSTPSMDWMEWADEGSLGAVGTIDFDGDGRRDTLYLDNEHEGGATHTHSTVMLRTANGTVSQLASIADLRGADLVNGKLVVGAVDEQQHRSFFRCLDKDRQIATCPEAGAIQRQWDKYDALARLEDYTAWNRDELAADFATVGIKGHADLVAAMPERSPEDRLRQHVEQFLIATNQFDPADARIERTHVEATRYFDHLASQLGDQPCTMKALTADVTKAVTKWVEHQAHQDMPLAIQPDCGNYVWTSYLKKDGQVEALLTVDGIDSTVAKVVTFPGQMFEGPGTQGFVHQGGFFAHGAALIGLVFEDTHIYAIANGKVLMKWTGTPRVLDYDTRWSFGDQSYDLVMDGAKVIHARPYGLEVIDSEPLREHLTHRTALDRVLDLYTPLDPTYLTALRTLGAPAALVAEAKARIAASAP
jgi:hypothetical protein